MLLHEKLKGKRIILASKSPRRRELLRGAGIPFVLADGYDAEEVWPEGMDPHEVPQYLSRLKSDAYPVALEPGEIVITADTVVILDGRVIGKPAGRDDAVAMLSALSGREHTVVTGVTIRDRQRTESFSVSSRVRFRRLRDEETEYYIDTFAPFDKAGAYGIQEWIGYAGIEGVEGSFYNVMGLPVQALYTRLEEFVG